MSEFQEPEERRVRFRRKNDWLIAFGGLVTIALALLSFIYSAITESEAIKAQVKHNSERVAKIEQRQDADSARVDNYIMEMKQDTATVKADVAFIKKLLLDKQTK